MTYYNTTDESGQLLLDYETKSKCQDALVLNVFKRLGRPLTPSEVWGFLTGSQEIARETPITSIRRSITNLTNDLFLIKTKEKGIGKYGRRELKWKYNSGWFLV